MKISLSSGLRPAPGFFQSGAPASAAGRGRGKSTVLAQSTVTGRAAFTMMEIAISLAIIGIALVAIIGVLPIGVNVQQSNRQQTIIGQDASVIAEDIRNGSLGANDLTNYIYAITNSWMEFNPLNNSVITHGVNGYTYAQAYVENNYPPTYPLPTGALTNGANIIGLLSMPEFTDVYGNLTANIYTANYYSNHVVAYAYAISGTAVEKPPQDNTLIQQDSLGYRLFVENTPEATETNIFYTGVTNYDSQLLNAVHELRLTFLWPQQPNGTLGPNRQTFRTLIAGQLLFQPMIPNFNNYTSISFNTNLYYYQAQSFTNSPYTP